MKPQSFASFCAERAFVLTPAQRVTGLVCFDRVAPCELEAADHEIARELFGDVESIPAIALEVILWLKGARVGGSRMSAMRAYQLGLTVPVELAPGESAFVLFVGPDTRLAQQAFRYATGAARTDVAAGRIRLVRESADSFTFERYDGVQVTLACLPATAGGSAVRARTLIAAVMTEAAFFRGSDSVINDKEIYRAMAARIVQGGQLILESTPWAQRELVYEMFRDNFADPKTALVARCPTTLMRPDARTLALVERERQRDPDNAAREFDCAFLEAGAAEFFDAVGITLAIDKLRPSVSYAPPGAVVGAGGDLALERNSSTIAVVARVADHYELLEIAERKPERGKPLKLGEEVLRGSFAPVLQRHGLHSFTADGHVREPAREFCATTKIKVGESERSLSIDAAPEGATGKAETYTLLQTIVREGRFKMSHYPRLESQLRAVVTRPLPGGGVRISSPTRPDGSHGDLVSALVLAVWAASKGGHLPPRRGPPPRSYRYSDMGGWSGGDRGRWSW